MDPAQQRVAKQMEKAIDEVMAKKKEEEQEKEKEKEQQNSKKKKILILDFLKLYLSNNACLYFFVEIPEQYLSYF